MLKFVKVATSGAHNSMVLLRTAVCNVNSREILVYVVFSCDTEDINYRLMQATKLGKWFRRHRLIHSTLISLNPSLSVDLSALHRVGTNVNAHSAKIEASVEALPHEVISSCSDIHDGARFGLDLTL